MNAVTGLLVERKRMLALLRSSLGEVGEANRLQGRLNNSVTELLNEQHQDSGLIDDLEKANDRCEKLIKAKDGEIKAKDGEIKVMRTEITANEEKIVALA